MDPIFTSMLTLLSVDEILLMKYMNWSIGMLFNNTLWIIYNVFFFFAEVGHLFNSTKSSFEIACNSSGQIYPCKPCRTGNKQNYCS